MSENAPPAPAASGAPEKLSTGKKTKKPAKATVARRRKSAGPSVSEMLLQAVYSSKERSGVSLAALKKALAAAGYDVDKNNSRIKLGLKTLVSKGTLVQTTVTGALGSFKLNKKAAFGETKPSTAKVSARPKATGAKKPKKTTTAATKKAVKSPRKVQSVVTKKSKAVKPKKVAKSPAKAKAVKPKAVKAKVTKPKITAKPKKAAPERK